VEYKDYLIENMKSGMLVSNNKTLFKKVKKVNEGSIGCILSFNTDSAIVSWIANGYSHALEFRFPIPLLDLDLCAPSFDTSIFL